MRSQAEIQLLLEQMRLKKKKLKAECKKHATRRDKQQLNQLDSQILVLEWIFEHNRLFDRLYQLRFERGR